jgi:hypothetical protein
MIQALEAITLQAIIKGATLTTLAKVLAKLPTAAAAKGTPTEEAADQMDIHRLALEEVNLIPEMH